MFATDHLPGRTLRTAAGREYLFCSGTGYLGVARSPAFAALLAEGLARYGTNYSSSRGSGVQLSVFAEAEAHLAGWAGTAGALTVSSGYLAGQMAVAALASTGRFEYAPGTHPATWLAGQAAPAPAGPHAAWADGLLDRLAARAPAPVVIVSNSLDPLRLEPYDFAWAAHLPTGWPITLLLDDSHGLGLTGRAGAGVATLLPALPPHVRLVVVSSLGKALGVPAGAVLADAAFIAQLRGSPFFGASSPAVPAYLWAFLAAERAGLYAAARQQLGARVAQFAAAVRPLKLFRSQPNFPVFYTEANALAPFLEARGTLISSFAYPTPADACITRVVLNALHTATDVAQVAAACQDFAAAR
ncbi:MAG: aminotransferase class I/II-fold pyridoxal phosphate-dependent enzyme [Janthinobacterium lividum]